VAEAWPLPGESKTTRAIVKHGFLLGLAASHTALLFDLQGRPDAVGDPVLPFLPAGALSRDGDLVCEWTSVGMSMATARELMASVVEDCCYAALQLADCAQRLTCVAAPVVTLLTLTRVADPTVEFDHTLSPRCPTLPSSSLPTTSELGGQQAQRSAPLQYLVVLEPSPAVVADFLQPVRSLDPCPPFNPWFRGEPLPLYDMALEEDVADALSRAGYAPAVTASDAWTAVLLVNESHLTKLRGLLHAAAVTKATAAAAAARVDCTDGAGGNALKPGGADAEMACLEQIFCLLARYETMGGGGLAARGFQGALPSGVFDALAARLGVSGECFASPLNCRLESRFCSAYEDTDAAFGSCGSFWRLPDSAFTCGGSWEVNPPFTPAVLLAAAVRVDSLLDSAQKAGQALLFFFVCPSWGEAPFMRVLRGSRWRCAECELGAGEHSYVDGMQQREDARWTTWTACAASCAFVLATDAACARWSLPAGGGEMPVEIRRAFVAAQY
jgi:hypothetical protein